MKIIIDSKTNEVKVNGKLLKDAPSHYKQIARNSLISAYQDNYPLSEYEEDCTWMSYRYCIGRHTISSHMHANEIWNNCKGRMSKEQQLFTAFDINREIENSLMFMKPYFHFPSSSIDKIYTPAVDIICQFLEDYDIKSIEDLIKYRDIHIILTDNERGYKFEATTWEEYLRPRLLKLMQRFYNNDSMSEDYAWKHYLSWVNNEDDYGALGNQISELIKDMPKINSYYMHDFEDLFVWNDLVHCFDYEHHHKSILTDGSEVEWFWSWTNNTEQHDDGYYYPTFGYKKIRVPVDKWNGMITKWIPNDSIKEDIY